MTRRSAVAAGRTGLYLLVLGFLVARLWEMRSGVATDLRRVGADRAALAGATALLGTLPGMLGWRALLAGLGTRLDLAAAAKVYYVGGLGKYLPGGIWPALTQADLARRLGQPPIRFMVAFPVSVAVSTMAGVGIGLCAVPWLAAAGSAAWAGAAVLAAATLLASPRLLRALLALPSAGRSCSPRSAG
jgi:hypothetical protein